MTANQGHALPRPGRYLGNDGDKHVIELRVDHEGGGILSADLFEGGVDSEPLLSLMTGAELRAVAGGFEAPVVVTDGTVSARGTLTLNRSSPDGDEQSARVVITDAVGVVASGTVFTFEVSWEGPEFRDLGLEVEAEDGVLGTELLGLDATAGTDSTTGRGLAEPPTVAACLANAGIKLRSTGGEGVLPAHAGGWHEADLFSELHRAMTESAGAPVGAPSWVVHLLWLSRTTREGLAGLMFDVDDVLPRQGAAVFVGALNDAGSAPDPTLETAQVGASSLGAGTAREGGPIKLAEPVTTHEQPPAEPERPIVPLRRVETVQTTAHEIGHTLNLVHRFELEVARSDSTSFMNYPNCYRGGGQAARYWQEFDFRLDADESEFLRHGPWRQVVPGGAPFGSARYYITGRQAVAVGREDREDGLEVWLTPPKRGTRFEFGQPVLLEVSVRNVGLEAVMLPRHILDVKAGILKLVVRDVSSPRQRPDGPPAFSPLVRRCFSTTDAATVELNPGESLHSNVNLSFGSAGFPVAQSGRYEVTPELVFVGADVEAGNFRRIASGTPLRIEIAAAPADAVLPDLDPLTSAEGRVALALGGASALEPALVALQGLADRRRHGDGDPIAVAIDRMLGIHAGRRGEADTAAGHLGRAVVGADQALDPHTAEHTRRLLARYEGAPAAPHAVVDFEVVESTGAVHGVRVEGVVTSWNRSRAWRVLAPADLLPESPLTPDSHGTVSATVTVAGADGLTERVRVARIDVLGAGEQGGVAFEQKVALLTLARAVQRPTNIEPDGEGPMAEFEAKGFWPPFMEAVGMGSREPMRGEQLEPWAFAADTAMWPAGKPAGARLGVAAADMHASPEISVAEVANWVKCLFSSNCEEIEPGHFRPAFPGQRRGSYHEPRPGAGASQQAM